MNPHRITLSSQHTLYCFLRQKKFASIRETNPTVARVFLPETITIEEINMVILKYILIEQNFELQ